MKLRKNMIPNKKIFLTLACSTLLQGCINIAAPQSQSYPYKKIAVISSATDEFSINMRGLTVFDNVNDKYNIDLGLNDKFANTVVPALSTKYEVTDLSQYGKQFAEQPKYYPGFQTIIGTETRPSVGEVIKRLVSPSTYDAYIVIGSYYTGIQKFPGLWKDAECDLITNYQVQIFDGKDYTYVGRGVPPVELSSIRIDCQAWKAPEQSISIIKPALDDLITRSLPETLKNAHLIP